MRIPFLPMLTLLAACATTTSHWSAREVRSADDTPPAFVTDDGEPAVQTCRSPMIDPRDQTRLRLIRSAPFGDNFRGDYEVPQGRYGVGPRELLRIDCESGEPIGIVAN